MPKKKIMLTCKDSGKFFHDCEDCDYYNKCTYFDKNKQLEADMKKRNLTNWKIRTAPTLELVIRMNYLHAKSKRRPQDASVPMTDILEAVAMFKEVEHRHGRLAALHYLGGKK